MLVGERRPEATMYEETDNNEDRKPEECDNTIYLIETKTTVDCASIGNGNKIKKKFLFGSKGQCNYTQKIKPSLYEIHHSCSLLVVGFLAWGLVYLMFGDLDGALLRLTSTAVLGYAAGQLLERLTTLPPLLGMLLVGILLRNVGFINIHNYRPIDSLLRKIYPVIILGKSSLGWDYRYMKSNLSRVLAFGILPWTAEVITFAACVHYILSYPWKWGFLLGAVFSSLSPAVLVPTVQQQYTRGLGKSREIPKLLGTAGGIDTTLSVGVYGLLLSAIFTEAGEGYMYFKASLTLFVGVTLGVVWGYVALIIPSKKDPFVAELRLLVVLIGGLVANFGTLAIGWGGTGGVAVLLCNFTAATLWRRSGYKLNSNPVATAYRVLWTICEPMLFTFTGAYVLISEISTKALLHMLAVLAASLLVRLIIAFTVAWGIGFTIKERLYVCITWIPKAIVEAVLAPTALDALGGYNNASDNDAWLARTNIHMLVLAILITTPLGYILANVLGPVLLDCKEDIQTGEDPPEDPRDPTVWTTQLGETEKNS